MTNMDRRSALMALTSFGATMGMGLAIQPVTRTEADDVVLVLIRSPHQLSQKERAKLHETWAEAVEGTPLANVRALVCAGDIECELVRQSATHRVGQ